MHIALYTHSVLPVQAYGGTQRVVVWLARGLAELGHEVTLLAPAGSRVPEAKVIELDPREIRRPGFDLTRLIPTTADVLHAHAPLATSPSSPHLYTLHGNLRAGRVAPENTVFLSEDHAKRHGGKAFVYNGVDPSDFEFRSVKDGYDLFLGRLHGVKGYRWAMEGARRAGKRLVVAGGWRLSLRPGLKFVGSVGGKRKADLLARAECLWMPALWDEPFGLTLVEAMMSGTPVLCTRRGALPEIVAPEAGAIGDTLDDLVALRPSIASRSAERCRGHAERWFTHRLMAQGYVRSYQHYLATGRLPPGTRIREVPSRHDLTIPP